MVVKNQEVSLRMTPPFEVGWPENKGGHPGTDRGSKIHQNNYIKNLDFSAPQAPKN